MPSPHELACPRCQHALKRVPVGASQCPHCNVWIRVPVWPVILVFLLAFAASLVVTGLLGLKAYAAILWFPILLMCFRYVLPLIPLSLPKVALAKGPPLQTGWKRNLVLFISIWIGLTFFIVAYGFVLGWGAFFLGQSSDVHEVMDMWSVPLGWVNHAFIVRPDKPFVAVLGIVAANCYFYALGITFIFKITQSLLRRGRVTELGLSGHTIDKDDDQL